MPCGESVKYQQHKDGICCICTVELQVARGERNKGGSGGYDKKRWEVVDGLVASRSPELNRRVVRVEMNVRRCTCPTTGMGPKIPEANRKENRQRGKNEAVAPEQDLKKMKRAQASRPWALRLFGSTVQVGLGTAEPVQPKTENIEPRTGLTVWFRKFTEPKLDQGSSSGQFRFGPRFRTELWQA